MGARSWERWGAREAVDLVVVEVEERRWVEKGIGGSHRVRYLVLLSTVAGASKRHICKYIVQLARYSRTSRV